LVRPSLDYQRRLGDEAALRPQIPIKALVHGFIRMATLLPHGRPRVVASPAAHLLNRLLELTDSWELLLCLVVMRNLLQPGLPLLVGRLQQLCLFLFLLCWLSLVECLAILLILLLGVRRTILRRCSCIRLGECGHDFFYFSLLLIVQVDLLVKMLVVGKPLGSDSILLVV